MTFKKRGFTLAEVMITMTVIGIITAIIIPVAMHTKPDENIMKFKKAHNMFCQLISTLLNSDKYYLDGDLGTKFDGTGVVNNSSTAAYFCTTAADVLQAKSVNCSTDHTIDTKGKGTINGQYFGNRYVVTNATATTIEAYKNNVDSLCKEAAKYRGKEIELTDGTVLYKVNSVQFGSFQSDNEDGTKTNLRFFTPPGQLKANYGDKQGIDMAYLHFCIDVDGFDESKGSDSCDDVKDICPFGYGVRADGKIIMGKRAEEWLKKSPQG